MSIYRERLFPGPSIFLMAALLIPASLLTFLPINLEVGAICAVVTYGTAVVLLLISSPVIEVTDQVLVAGRARLPLANSGEASGYYAREATAERGTRLDARAWLVIRGWISPVVKVVVEDESDPAPYWLFSSRHPDRVVEALATAKARLNNA
jgi:hypothetical protein